MMDDLNDIHNTNETYNNDTMTTIAKNVNTNSNNNNNIQRPDSSQITELHVYIFPKQFWNMEQNMAYDYNVKDLVSLGFLRTNKELILGELRKEIDKQCSREDLPKEYTFLKNVGRALTRVKNRQENEIKVKNYLPTQEIFILDSSNLMETPSDINSTKNGLEDNEEDGFYTSANSKTENNNEHHMPSMIRNSKLNLRQSSKSNFMNDGQLTSSSNQLDKIPDEDENDVKKVAKENKLVSKHIISEVDYEKLLEEQERLRLRQIELEKMRMLQMNKNGDPNAAANIVITSRGTVAQQENNPQQQLGNINLTIYVKNDELNSNNGMRIVGSTGVPIRNSQKLFTNGKLNETVVEPFSSYDNGGGGGSSIAPVSFKEFKNNLNRNRTQVLRQVNDKYFSTSIDDIMDTYSNVDKIRTNQEYNRFISQNYLNLNDGNLTKMMAATKIQSFFRGYRDRKMMYQRYKDLYE